MTSRPLPKLKTLLWRGCRKKCPQCGEGPLYQRWMKLHDHCPVCGLQYLANQGDLFGTLLFLDRILFLIPLVVLIYFRLWHPSQIVFILFGGALLFVLIFTMPHRNGASLAVDYWIRRKNDDPPEKKSSSSK
jgi:uncharacterized protein (DUF983 family)